MAITDEAPELTAGELERVQSAIDAGTIWSTVDGGRFAMRLIKEKKCKVAPGVVGMWLTDDDHYEPVYSRGELNRRVDALLEQLPKVVAEQKRIEAEVAFLEKHQPELIKIGVEEQLSSAMISPLLPALALGGLSALFLYVVGASPLYGGAVGVLAHVVQSRRAERRRRDTQQRVNELRAKAGLSPESSAQ
jgi:hypothetical protein